jgi:hypothetical protein
MQHGHRLGDWGYSDTNMALSRGLQQTRPTGSAGEPPRLPFVGTDPTPVTGCRTPIPRCSGARPLRTVLRTQAAEQSRRSRHTMLPMASAMQFVARIG